MLDMNLTTHYLEVWSRGEDWAPQEFNIHKITKVSDDFPDNVGNGIYVYIDHQSTGKRLTNQLDNVAGEDPREDSTQVWELTRLSNGAYVIESAYNNACFDVLGITEDDGANVYAYTGGYVGGLNQQFYIYHIYDAYYFRPAHSSRNVMLDMNQTTFNLEQWVAGENWAPQEFEINEVVHTITYSAEGGEITSDIQQKGYNESIIIQSDIPTRRGYTFVTWNSRSDGLGVNYSPGSIYSDNYSVTLYAIWKENCDISHNYSYIITKAPTTSATGTLTGTCSKCNGTTTVTLPKLNTTDYTYSVTKAATCTAAGTGRYTRKTTTYGSFYFDVSIAATGHSYTYKATKAPTTSATGTLTGTCSKCSGTTTVTLPKLNTTDYTYKVIKGATCSATGTGRYTWKTTTYGTFYFDVTIAATGHSYSYKATKAPTTSATGTLTGTCSKCSGTTTVTLPKLNTTDYTYTVTKAATCTAAGTGRYTWKTTTYGSFSFDVSIAATGHSYAHKITKPTCTAEGFTVHTCIDCGNSYKDAYTAALGHDWKGTSCRREGCNAKRETPFTDVPEDSFYIDPVLWAVENGITTGASATTFNPDGQCQRAQVVTFLWRAAGCPDPTGTINPFVDVQESDFYYQAVRWAVEKGITNGLDATHFGPYANCNRAQVVTFLWRTMGEPASAAEVGFTDVVDGQFYAEPVAWAVENGITNGMGDGTFGVNGICNRAQVVTFLYRAYVN